MITSGNLAIILPMAIMSAGMGRNGSIPIILNGIMRPRITHGSQAKQLMAKPEPFQVLDLEKKILFLHIRMIQMIFENIILYLL